VRRGVVRKGSTTRVIDWQPIAATPRACRALHGKWTRALKAYEKKTRRDRIEERPGRRRGAVGRVGVRCYEELCGAQNHATGELFLSHVGLGERAGIHERTVADALDDLEAIGMVKRILRADKIVDENGDFQMVQISNAYILLSPSNWKGPALLFDDLDPPPPDDDALGRPERIGDALDEAAKVIDRTRRGQNFDAIGRELERGVVDDKADTLDAALLRLWRVNRDRRNE
jgi:hypothetical protein